jgi:hypothetical protein
MILGVLVIIAAAVVGLAGMAGLLLGLAGLLPGVPSNRQALVSGVLFLVLSAILFTAGGGLLALRPWAWWLAIFATVVAAAASAYGIYQALGGPGPDLTAVVTLAILGVILAYLISVYRYFRGPSPAVQ